MKIVLEILIALVLHPVAVVLVWLNLAGRNDIGAAKKVVWAVVALVWGFGPLLYMFVGGGELW